MMINEIRKRRFDKNQYEILIRCSEKRDLNEWNERRKNIKETPIFLEGAELGGVNLQGADLSKVDLSDAELWKANLRGTRFRFANLKRNPPTRPLQAHRARDQAHQHRRRVTGLAVAVYLSGPRYRHRQSDRFPHQGSPELQDHVGKC
jgi:hypothetical protein